MGATAVILLAAERRVIEHLRIAGAVRESDAITLDGLSAMELRRAERLVASGAVRKTSDGRYWLDEKSVAGRQRRRRRIIGSVVAILITLLILGIFITPAPLP